ncbi:spore germination protein [Gottfriedia luciferensis]|uniref:spore germination protein n=1 Tax=Gottfriedia luciferensis TaxID=178774 RepID=UPI000B444C37|nr:spore germination protein [Gottfriedia luciferensis]
MRFKKQTSYLKSYRRNKEKINNDSQLISKRITINVDRLKQELGNCSDLVIREFKIAPKKGVIAHIDGISDTKIVSQFILSPLQSISFEEVKNNTDLEVMTNTFKKHVAISDINEVDDWNELVQALLFGDTVILLDGSLKALVASTRSLESRSVTEPTTQTLIRGPKDSFTESLRTNTSLIRARIASPSLRIDALTIGEISNTSIAILYIENIAKNETVQNVKNKLQSISIDGVLESGYIESFIQDKKFSIFPTILNTERPDVVSANLLEGRVAILVNGTPFALTVPTTFFQFFQSPEDYFEKYEIGTLLRTLRIIAFFIAFLTPAIYIALITQHQAMIPTILIISIAAQREGVPLPTIVEAMILEIAFELLREAGVRMPKAVGQAGAIVGALILGQTAVQAGLVSAATIIVVAITAIASFTIPYYNMAITARILRFIFMIAASYMGLYGIVLLLLTIGAYLCKLSSFGVPYLSPVAPFILDEQKDTFLRLPWNLMKKRPSTAKEKNKNRLNSKNGEPDEAN